MRAHLASSTRSHGAISAIGFTGVLRLAAVCSALGACTIDPRQVELTAVVTDDGGTSGNGGTGPCASNCPEVICPADDACKDYAGSIPAGSCSIGGGCPSAADCLFDWKPAAREGTACACDGETCRLLAGNLCTAPTACNNGSCLATNTGSSVCCDVTCAPNEACAADGKSCEPLQPCEEGARRCSSSSYQQCSMREWATLEECSLGCSAERGGCLLSAGKACTANEDCGEGSCLATSEGASVCCTAACEGACQRCAPSGTECANVEDDAACGSIACPTADPCRAYAAPSVESARCLDGQCKTPEQACSFTPQNQNQECSPTSLCDAMGGCSQPKHAEGDACSAAAECESGACVAAEAGGSVCCASPCAPNELCASAGGCMPAPVCTNGATQCSGSDWQSCSGGQWATEAECGTLGCSEELGGCLPGAGAPCQADTDCGVGSCLPTADGDSVCCTAACAGACRRCAGSGLTCDTLDDDEACGSIACPADETCRNYPESVDAQRCVDGRCGTAAELCVGTPRAQGQPCDNDSLCDTEGNCNASLLPVGTPCSIDGQCRLGFCANGVCCNEACNANCETCDSTGVCVGTATDPDCGAVACSSLDPECTTSIVDIDAGQCREKGACMDNNDCGLAPDRSMCVGTFIIGYCDGQGHCNEVTLPCGGQCAEGMTAFHSCCVSGFDGSIACSDTTACILDVQSMPTGNIAVRCYDNLDCSPGNLCCLTHPDGPRIDCAPADTCLTSICGAPGHPRGACLRPEQQCFPISDPSVLQDFWVCQ